jgi:cytochrome c biogenesis protein CcmG/thiol:disulfide interchange protein DsbE
MEATRKSRQCAFVLLVTALAVVAAGCGSSSSTGSKPPDYATALDSAPARLAALYAQTDYGKTPVILDSGLEGVNEELAKLNGTPVVINAWGSWCGPCREEFPYLQQASAKFGSKVAFLGIDTEDQDDAAKTFLGESPLPYPSYADPDGTVKNTYSLVGLPATLIYDRTGKLVSTHQGPYTSEADLAADIKRYTQ